MITEANSAKVKKETSDVKIGDIILTSAGYAKVTCLNPVQGISIVRGRRI